MAALGDDPAASEFATPTNNFLFVSVVKTEIKEELCSEDGKLAVGSQAVDSFVTVKNDPTEQNPGRVQPSGQKHSCRTCREQFVQRWKLKQHEVSHVIRKLHKCKLCSASFLRNYLLLRHNKTHSRSNVSCASDFSSVNENSGMVRAAQENSRTVPTFECPICSEAVSGILNLNKHAAEHSVNIPFKCGLCINRFKEESELVQHSVEVHKKEESYFCKFCYRKFRSHLMLGDHMLEHEDKSFKDDQQERLKCHFCNKYFRAARYLVEHLRLHVKNTPFRCQICDKAFGKNYSLIGHMRIHSGEKPFKCDICGIHYRFRSSLRFHVDTHKVRERSYACDVCGKGFLCERSLVKHRKTHAKKHRCIFCRKVYATKQDLDEHYLTHRKQRPYKCQYCVFAYLSRGELHKHMKKHILDEPFLKPFGCEHCEKFFTFFFQLRHHIQKEHGSFGCTVCKQRFKSREALDAHVNQHFAERNKCQYCGMSFMSEFGLTLHMRIHTGERQLKCFSCKVYRKPVSMKQRPCPKCAKLNEGISSTPVLPVTTVIVETKPEVKLERD